MPLTKTFGRETVTVVNKNNGLVAEVVEDTTNGTFVMNISTTITKDDSTTVNKLLYRFKVKPVYSGKNNKDLTFEIISLLFAGNAATFTTGLATPPDASKADEEVIGRTTRKIDLDIFYAAAGDVTG